MRKATVLLGMVALVCGSAMAGVSGDFIDYPLTDLYAPLTTMTQTDDLITITATSPLVAYDAAVGTPASDDMDLAALITFDETLTELGFCARMNMVGGFTLYALSFNPTNGYLALIRIDNATTFVNLELDHADGYVNNSGGSFNISFSLDGDNLSGELWNEANDTLLASVSSTDSNYTTGAAGVFALVKTSGIGGSWAEVPEPTTMALLGAGGLALLRRRRK